MSPALLMCWRSCPPRKALSRHVAGRKVRNVSAKGESYSRLSDIPHCGAPQIVLFVRQFIITSSTWRVVRVTNVRNVESDWAILRYGGGGVLRAWTGSG